MPRKTFFSDLHFSNLQTVPLSLKLNLNSFKKQSTDQQQAHNTETKTPPPAIKPQFSKSTRRTNQLVNQINPPLIRIVRRHRRRIESTAITAIELNQSLLPNRPPSLPSNRNSHYCQIDRHHRRRIKTSITAKSTTVTIESNHPSNRSIAPLNIAKGKK